MTRAAQYFSARATKLRPHYKAHKCSKLMQEQLRHGSCVGVTCATAWEAQVLAAKGIADVLVANEVADPHGLEQLATAARSARVTVCVDDLTHVKLLEATAEQHAVTFGVLIEVDVGMVRCGLPPGSTQLLPIAAAVAAANRLEFAGLQGYEGHAVLKDTREQRINLVAEGAAILTAERARLEEAGFTCRIVSGGGTGTFDIATEAGALNEIQAGSYVLMDARYATLDLPYENALYCCTTVISRHGDGAVIDGGLKALSAEYGMSRPVPPELEMLKLSDEHAQLSLPDDYHLAVGDTLLVIPRHIDPTINLYGSLFVFTTPTTVEEWPVDGRRPASYTGASA